MQSKQLYLLNLMTILIIFVWGITFVSTKVLILEGLTPAEIFTERFCIALVGLWILCPKPLTSGSLKDEFMLFLAGITGGSLYFVTENTALAITYASNVSLLICLAPIFTLILARIFLGTKVTLFQVMGSLLAYVGVWLVVFNGQFRLIDNNIGDALAIAAALSWAFYCLLIKKLSERYSTLFITRQVFLYALISQLLFFLYDPTIFHFELLTKPIVWGNLLFLSLIGSLLCFIGWSHAVKELGAAKTANYIYLTPLFTLCAAAVCLSEPITVWMIGGGACILLGVFIVEKSKAPAN